MRKCYFALLLLVLTACPTDLSSALRQYGFFPVRPASSMWVPGSFVFVKSRSPFEVGFICTASQMMGPNYMPLESMTTNADLVKASKKGFTMGAQVQDILDTDAELSNIKNVSMLIRNVRHFEISDYDVFEAARRPNKRCLRAIAMRKAQGYDVTFISAAIQADISFQITWHKASKLDVKAKVAAAQNLSAKLGVQSGSVSDKSIQARGLIWGIKDDLYLAHVIANNQDSPAPDRGSKIFDPNSVRDLEINARGIEPRGMPITPTDENPVLMDLLPPVKQSQSAQAVMQNGNLAVSLTPDAVIVTPQPSPSASVPQTDVPQFEPNAPVAPSDPNQPAQDRNQAQPQTSDDDAAGREQAEDAMQEAADDVAEKLFIPTRRSGRRPQGNRNSWVY